jgi:hypothetical protein
VRRNGLGYVRNKECMVDWTGGIMMCSLFSQLT